MYNRLACVALTALMAGLALGRCRRLSPGLPANPLRLAGGRSQGLLEATKNKDNARLRAIFGVEVNELASGDEVQDRADLEEFSRNLAAVAKLVPDGDDKVTLLVGPMRYSFPVPLVRKDGQWHFDTPAARMNCSIAGSAENELQAIAVCRGYVAAQRDYYAQDFDNDDVIEYAQRIASTPGKKDGLYWETRDNEPPARWAPRGRSPTRGLRQANHAAGVGPRPYHGYYYRILTRQGEHAAGGKHDYVLNGHMVAGFAWWRGRPARASRDHDLRREFERQGLRERPRREDCGSGQEHDRIRSGRRLEACQRVMRLRPHGGT